jgi:hypothetical protein
MALSLRTDHLARYKDIVLCFLAAAGGGLTLVWNIVRSDLHREERPTKRP